jgi:glucokinase
MSQVVGIDASGTKLAAGLVDLPGGRVIRRHEAPANPWRGGKAVLADCVTIARKVAVGHADGIGMAVPELVALDGQITSAVAWDWRDADLASTVASIGPVRVDSDVRAAAMAEAQLGAGQGRSSFLYLTIGTGVSHTFVVDGTPWPGRAVMPSWWELCRSNGPPAARRSPPARTRHALRMCSAARRTRPSSTT